MNVIAFYVLPLVLGGLCGWFLSVPLVLATVGLAACAIFYGGYIAKTVDGLPGIIGWLIIVPSVVFLFGLGVAYYISSGQTLIQDLFNATNFRILR